MLTDFLSPVAWHHVFFVVFYLVSVAVADTCIGNSLSLGVSIHGLVTGTSRTARGERIRRW